MESRIVHDPPELRRKKAGLSEVDPEIAEAAQESAHARGDLIQMPVERRLHCPHFPSANLL
jgi:hypothetical protein